MRQAALLLLSGLSFACAAPNAAPAEPAIIARPSRRDPYGDHIAEAAQRFALPAAWIRAVLDAESNGDPRATSPKGAIGLMQIMPDTWAELRLRHRLGADSYDPHDNIIAGAAYIRALYDRYGSPGWIAAYNAGPKRYESSLRGRSLPAETRAYVATVASNLGGRDDRHAVVIASADRLAWTDAPLFAVQRTSAASADPASPDRSSDGAAATATVRDVSAIAPRSGGLFVARAAEGIMR